MPKITPYIIAMAVLLASSSLQAGPVLTLDPADGALSGQPGQSVAWGFTLTNDTNYLVVNQANYVTATPLGTFTDFISGFFVVIGNGPFAVSSWTQLGDAGSQTGIGSYAIDPSTLLGSFSAGSIEVSYDL